MELLKVDFLPGKAATHAIVRLNKGSGIAEVALAFVVNVSKYAEDLRKHGVKTEI